MDLSSVDLNLLVSLNVLLSEESVSRAAARLHRTQPAVSAALARLRVLFDDPLLVRQGTRMVPTPLARSLRRPLREIIRSIEHTLGSRPTFDPATSDRRFRIATTDYAELTVIPGLIRTLRSEAPNVYLELFPFDERVSERLREGDIDLVIADEWSIRHLESRVTLFREEFVCLVARDHPRVGRRMTRKRYVSEHHILMSARGIVEGNVDQGLDHAGETRRVILSVPHFMAIPAIVADSDLVVTLPRRVGEFFSRFSPVRTLKPPIEVPGFNVAYAIHGPSALDPAIEWLEAVLR